MRYHYDVRQRDYRDPEALTTRVFAPEKVCVAEFAFGWTREEPVTLHLGGDIWLQLAPYTHGRGYCSAYMKRHGVTFPLAMDDPRVRAGLEAREVMEALA